MINLFYYRNELQEYAEMNEKEKKKKDLEKKEKEKKYKARKMHYLLSTEQVGIPVPDSSCKPLGPPA